MTIRLRDRVTLLEPRTVPDPDTDVPVPDPDGPRLHRDVPFRGEQTGSTEQALTANTVVSDARGWLDGRWAQRVTNEWRVRWRDADHEIVGHVEQVEGRGRVQHIVVNLRRIGHT